MDSTTISAETLAFLRALLNQVTVSAADPEFEKAAATIARASRELDAAIAQEL